MTLAEFETLALTQRPATEDWQPVTDYSVMTRRVVEGKHPRLILQVLKPTSILDAGCGPGMLMYLLKEQGATCSMIGIDKTTHGRCADLADPLMWMSSWSADLVICREVLEHLTLREIRIAVTNLCKMSTRLVYGTTRFAADPDILSVETHDALDPTHITLASQALLRVLFALEGFRYREDLTEQMDWKHYGRAFVYERAV